MPLIAEGVDAIVQVKASLDGREIKSAFKNAASVKRVRREFRNVLFAKAPGDERDWTRIPYFVVAFEGPSPDKGTRPIGVTVYGKGLPSGFRGRNR